MTKFLKEKIIAMVFNKKTNFVILGLILSCLFSYAYFANSAVHALADLQNTKSDMQALNVEVSEMESKRLSLDNSINPELAKNMGFVEIKNQTFIMDKPSNAALSFKTN